MYICTYLETECIDLHPLVPSAGLVQFYTMPTPEQIYAALEARRAELGLSQAEVGVRAFGKADNAAFQALRRGSSPSAEKLAALCQAVDWEFYFGPRRESSVSAAVPVDSTTFAQIPLVDAKLAAGDGAHNSNHEVVEHLAFRQEWLKRLHLNPANAVLARVTGESMRPTLEPGDTLLIDTSQSERHIEVRLRAPLKAKTPIYAFRSGGDERVKRVLRPDNDTLILLSDNPDWAPEIIHGAALRRLELSIIGRVVWWGHTERE